MSMTPKIRAALLGATVLAAFAAPAAADFKRTALWPVYTSLPAGEKRDTETAAEIIARARGGELLIFTDSPRNEIGFLDIKDPAAPKSLGKLPMNGEPTSVAVKGDIALVAVNTSKNFVEPSGHIAAVKLSDRSIVATCDVKGQPDSVAVSPDGRFLAVAVENERDEKKDKGKIPQLPGGHLAILELAADGLPSNCANATIVALTGLAQVAPEDPEPEFVSINAKNQAVITLQENNHIVIVDLATAKVINHFSAGSVTLEKVDAKTDKRIALTDKLENVRREPDAVAWIDDTRFVTADEGDYEGGSRGFTIFDVSGKVLYASGNAIEHLAVAHGHFPDRRARAKGSEPEGVAVAKYGTDTFIFVGSERGNFIAVYRDRGATQPPEFVQLLPGGIAPEGILPIPERGLLAVANEADNAKNAVRSTIALYRLTPGSSGYPMIKSDTVNGLPIGWGALSGITPEPTAPGRFYVVPDSFYQPSRILTLDMGLARHARITAELALTKDGKPVDYDLEGIAKASDGGFWLVSEGNPEDKDKPTESLLLKVSAKGVVEQEIALPAAITAQATRFGFEGVAATGRGGAEIVHVVFQREWKDDPKGQARIGRYDPAKKAWSFARYPLEAASGEGVWMGLSEIAAMPDGRFAILERDNQRGPDAKVKRVYAVDLSKIAFAPAGAPAPLVTKTLLKDFLPDLQARTLWTPDKPEGLTVTRDGTMWVVTDNDGVDNSNGETVLLNLGTVAR